MYSAEDELQKVKYVMWSKKTSIRLISIKINEGQNIEKAPRR